MAEPQRLTIAHGSRVQVIATGIFFGFCTPMFFVQALNPGKGGVALVVIALLSSVASGWCLVRALRSTTLIADTLGATVRTLFRTRAWTWAGIDRFDVAERPVGVMAWPRRVLRVWFPDHTSRWLVEMNVGPKDRRMDDLAACLNQVIAWDRECREVGVPSSEGHRR